MSRATKALLASIIVAAVLWALTPSRLDYVPQLPVDIDVQSFARDQSSGLIAGTEKRIVWYNGEQKTAWSIVALHGFSASRQETAPLAEEVARRLQANLFETRLSGHGLVEQGLTSVTAEQWLDDAAQALAVGTSIGEKLVVIGSSTGATLAMAMLEHSLMAKVDSLIFLSPNFLPRDGASVWLTRPAGPLVARIVMGETRSWTAYNDLQALYWTTSYPSATTVQVMRLVDRARGQLPAKLSQRLQIFYSPDDKVISTAAIAEAYGQINSPQKEIVVIRNPGDPSHHILAGNILSADKTNEIASRITAFISPPTP